MLMFPSSVISLEMLQKTNAAHDFRKRVALVSEDAAKIVVSRETKGVQTLLATGLTVDAKSM